MLIRKSAKVYQNPQKSYRNKKIIQKKVSDIKKIKNYLLIKKRYFQKKTSKAQKVVLKARKSKTNPIYVNLQQIQQKFYQKIMKIRKINLKRKNLSRIKFVNLINLMIRKFLVKKRMKKLMKRKILKKLYLKLILQVLSLKYKLNLIHKEAIYSNYQTTKEKASKLMKSSSPSNKLRY